MRKQVDFDVRVFPLGNGANDSMTRIQIAEWLRNEYFFKPNVDKDGKPNPKDLSYWEIFDVATNQVSAGVISYQVTLVKYLDNAQ